MVYTSQQWQEDYYQERIDVPMLLDPSLLRAARQIYRTYYEVHPDHTQRPSGVAIDRYTFRGKLIFRSRPILLPRECFVPFSQLEAEIY
ncbi:MAG: hypothetical protein LDL41_20180 [Coleofasciculus sp. S288]|nr:hypothetical protein [Coleofasciculus sp. S288]